MGEASDEMLDFTLRCFTGIVSCEKSPRLWRFSSCFLNFSISSACALRRRAIVCLGTSMSVSEVVTTFSPREST